MRVKRKAETVGIGTNSFNLYKHGL